MSMFIFVNNLSTTLASAITNAATTITLSSSANIPTIPAGAYLPITLNDAATKTVYEIMYATAASGTSLTVMRAQEGTTAQAWAAGDFVFSTATAASTAPSGGNSANRFQVATAVGSSDATPLAQVQALVTAGTAGVSSFNSRTGNVTLTNTDVNGALGYTAANQATTLANPMNAVGDLIVGGSGGTPTKLGIGASGTVLTVSGSTLEWSAASSSGTYTQAGTGAITRPVQDKLRQYPDVTDYSADPTGAANSSTAFSNAAANNKNPWIPPGSFLLNSTVSAGIAQTFVIQDGASITGSGGFPASMQLVKFGNYTNSWVQNVNGGVFNYIPGNGALTVFGRADSISISTANRTSTGSGANGSANIGVAAFINNDNTTGVNPGGWGLYSTVVRQNGVSGVTHGLEIDVCNFGGTVPLYPASPFSGGQNEGIWLCTGGEAATAGGAGTVSCAMAIIQNDASSGKTAKFDKGILSHSTAIAGANGTGGSNLGVAIAFAAGHQQIWFNNSNQAVAEIVASGTNASTATRLELNSYGFNVQDRGTGAAAFQVVPVSGGTNYISIQGGTSSVATSISAAGTDTNIDIWLRPKGTGVFMFGYSSYAATAPSSFKADRILAIKDGSGVVYYLPASSTTW